MPKAWYVVPQKGDGKSMETGYRPDLPEGFDAWVLCSEAPDDTWVLLVSGPPEYHQALKADPNILWLADAEPSDAEPI